MKDVPQCSILGPLYLNIFLSDIFYFVTQSSLYNYANGKILSFIHKNLAILIQVLEQGRLISFQWFTNDHMKANPSKFQTICAGKKAF